MTQLALHCRSLCILPVILSRIMHLHSKFQQIGQLVAELSLFNIFNMWIVTRMHPDFQRKLDRRLCYIKNII